MIEITVTRKLDDTFAPKSELEKMPDERVIELIFDDFGKFLNGADWKVSRVIEDIV